jgi:hypothetical protein
MSRAGRLAIAGVAALTLGLAVLETAEAGSGHRGGRHGGRSGGHHHRHHGGHRHHWHHHGGFFFPFFLAPLPAYAYTVPVVPPPVYVQQPAYAEPVPAQPYQDVQREVVYPHGRYVLYGDGITQPWQWVWIPR